MANVLGIPIVGFLNELEAYYDKEGLRADASVFGLFPKEPVAAPQEMRVKTGRVIDESPAALTFFDDVPHEDVSYEDAMIGDVDEPQLEQLPMNASVADRLQVVLFFLHLAEDVSLSSIAEVAGFRDEAAMAAAFTDEFDCTIPEYKENGYHLG